MKKAFLYLIIFVLTVFFSFPGVTLAKTFRLVIGAGHPVDASVWITPMRDFMQVEVKKRVEAETEHKIEWVEAYGGSLAKLGEVLEAVQTGLMDIGDTHVPFEPSKLKAYNFGYFVPFGTEDSVKAAKAAVKVFQDYPQLREYLEKQYNQVYLATGAVNCYNLVTTFPWDKVSQLKGRKIAAAGPNIPWVQAVGAVPVQSNLNEAYTSLQTGVYDGWVMFADATVSFKLHEVAKYFTVTGFGAIPNTMITINKNTWNSFPPKVQQIFREVGSQYHNVQTKMAVAKLDSSFKTMRDTGCQVREMNWDEKVKWAKSLPNIPKERAKEITDSGLPGDVIYTYINSLKAQGVKLPRDWSAEK